MASAPPIIFSAARRAAIRRRMHRLQALPDAPRYLLADMIEDVLERLAFLRHQPKSALVIGEFTGELAAQLQAQGCQVTTAEPGEFNEEAPLSDTGFDLIASLGTLDTVNDLPGALLHIRNALAPGGLMIASFIGAGSLPRLRSAMLAADGDRPAARLHPAVDVRAGGQLLQRTGFSRPVVDSRALDVRFSSLASLLADLRAQGLSNALNSRAPTLTRAMRDKASRAFMGEDDRVTEVFEILTLSGWRA